MASTPWLLAALGVAALTTVGVVMFKPNVDAAFFAVEASGPLNIPIKADYYARVITLYAMLVGGTVVAGFLLYRGLK